MTNSVALAIQIRSDSPDSIRPIQIIIDSNEDSLNSMIIIDVNSNEKD